MKLRLYHHHDGARVAYREAGTGPALALLHSALLTHREWEPLVEELSDRFRLVLPDLPLHGDSEDRPRHPYSPDWMAEVIAGFCREVCGPRPLVGGHDVGALILLRAVQTRQLTPGRLVIMPSALHRRPTRHRLERIVLGAARAGAVPGLDRAVSHAARMAFRPEAGEALSARGNPAARDLVRHAFADVGGDATRARAWARAARPLADRRAVRPARRLPPDRRPDAAAVGRRGPPAPALDRRGGARPAARRAPARPPGHRLPARLRRPGRAGARARGVLHVVERRPDRGARLAARAHGGEDVPRQRRGDQRQRAHAGAVGLDRDAGDERDAEAGGDQLVDQREVVGAAGDRRLEARGAAGADDDVVAGGALVAGDPGRAREVGEAGSPRARRARSPPGPPRAAGPRRGW